MMANPIPPVPNPQRVFQEFQEVKVDQPAQSPRPSPLLEKKFSDEEVIDEMVPITEVEQPELEELLPTATEPKRLTLQDLTGVDMLSVTRQLEVKGMLKLQGKKNQFSVRTPDHRLVYTVQEDNSWWVGYFCYGLRPMQLRVMTADGTEVLRIVRPYAFTTRILPCQLQRMQVFSPPGHLIGSVAQQWAPIRPTYTVKDATGSVVFDVIGPRITVSCCQDVQFHVRRPDGSLVASTNKRWEGLVHALFFAPVKDKFAMTFFEKEMKEQEKALVLATALLLDYMYYDV